GCRQRQEQRKYRCQCGDVDGLDQRSHDGAETRELRRRHTAEQVTDLHRRVPDPGPVDVEVANRPVQHRGRTEVGGETQQALAEREALPAVGALVAGHVSPCLTRPLRASLRRMMTIITSKMASAKS